MRIWLPDAPGVLGAVAAEIGAAHGNVVGLEVLEREAGGAIDQLVVELPDEPGAVDAACRGVRNVMGAGVEEVIELGRSGASEEAVLDREDGVLGAALEILAGTTAETALKALTNRLIALFDLSWLAVMDDRLEQFEETHGRIPSVEWVVAFAEGARSGADPANDTMGSGVFVEPVPGSERTVCGGRASPVRRKERNEITMLVMVASRYIGALMGRDLGGLRGGGGD